MTVQSRLFKKFISNRRGYTLIEVLLVIGIIALLLATSVPFYQIAFTKGDLDTNASKLLTNIRFAQAMSMNGLENDVYGIHLDSSSLPQQYTLFKGTTFNPSETYNQTFELSSQISIEDLNLNGGGSDILFSEFSGETINYGTITLGDRSGNQRVILINEIGMIDVE